MKPAVQHEHHFFAEPSAGGMFCVYHEPHAPPQQAVLMCAPLHEEKKSVHRPLVDAARVLAQHGAAVLRFDYRGSGDSPGDPLDVTPTTMRQDILAAAEILRNRSGIQALDLVAIRLGATMAACVMTELDPPRALLCEPIIQGRRYLAHARTRKRVRKMVTAAEAGQAASTPPPEEPEDFFDYDGHPISPACMDELDAIDLMALDGPLSGEIVILEVAARQKTTAAAQALAEKLERRGARVSTKVIIAEPFWNALDPVSVPAFTDAIVEAVFRSPW